MNRVLCWLFFFLSLLLVTGCSAHIYADQDLPSATAVAPVAGVEKKTVSGVAVSPGVMERAAAKGGRGQ